MKRSLVISYLKEHFKLSLARAVLFLWRDGADQLWNIYILYISKYFFHNRRNVYKISVIFAAAELLAFSVS